MPCFSRSTFAYYLCCCGLLFAPLANGTQTPATVTLGDLSQTYDGTPKAPTISTQPPQLPTQVVYRNLSPTAPAAVSEVVYDDTPNTLDLSYYSYSFAAQNLSAIGNLVQLGGTARKLQSCDVIFVTWAKAATYPTFSANNPVGYVHPITITIYEVNSTNQLIFRTEATQDILVPWRPTKLPDGNTYPYNGYAFRTNVSFSNGIVLPERALVMVSFNTQSTGFSPLGVNGPYNELNLGYKTGPNVAVVGSDVNADTALQVRNGIWYYPSTGWINSSAPMIRLRALSTESTTPPINAGNWQATVRVSNPDYLGNISSPFTINPAAAIVQLSELVHLFDGNPKSAKATTSPAGLAVTTTYNGSISPPSLPGTYTVHTEIANPNYQGSPAVGELSLIGYTLNSWLNPWVASNLIPPANTGDQDDPDQDSIPNLLEYALALDPSGRNPALPNLGKPQLEYSAGQLSLIFRKNLGATDLQFQVESTTQLGGLENWSPALTSNSVIGDDGLVQTIRATVTTAPGESHRFLRLRVSRVSPN